MKYNKTMKHAFAFIFLLLTQLIALQAAVPTDLHCEYRDKPLGIDVPQPRLSWQLMDVNPKPHRGEKQTAYQVLAASSETLLKKDHGDLWDSGRINSDQSIAVRYAGLPRRSQTRYYWKIRL